IVINITKMTTVSSTITRHHNEYDTLVNVFINKYQYLKERLYKTDFKKLKLCGRPLFIRSFDLGIKKAMTVLLKMKRYKVRMMEPKLFNPIWFMKKTLFVYQKQKRAQKYYDG